MKFLSQLNIRSKILINILIAIFIIGSISISEYNSLITTENIKSVNHSLYTTQIKLYELQYLSTQCANLAIKSKDISNLPEFIATKEKFVSIIDRMNQILNYLKTINVGENADADVKDFYSNFNDTLYKYEQIISDINIEFEQINKYKNRILKPHNIEEHYLTYIQEESDIINNGIPLTSSSFLQTIVDQIINKYKQNIDEHIKAINYNISSLNSSINRHQISINSLIQNNNKYLADNLQHTKVNNIVIFILGILIVIVLTIIMINSIIYPLKDIENIIRKLSLGELPNYKPISENNDIGYISSTLFTLINSLKETSEFVEQLSKGNFDIEFAPLSDKDEFRNYLLDLRDSLKKAKEEEERRKIEDYQRRRVSEGLAKFAEILRGQHKDLKKLAENIIINLVRYLNANQGVFFIINDKNPNDVYLELYAAYAWNKKKYLEKRINLGEGLIGAVAVEKFTIYMTDVPEDYIEIKSGTGEADPRAILIVPIKVEENVLGVIEIATFEEFKQYEIELVEKIAESIASTLQNIRINEKTEELLRRSQLQAEEMKRQEEIMRKTIEELKHSQEENSKKELQLKKLLEDLEKANQNLKIKDLELEKEIQRLKNNYNKKIEVISRLSASYQQILAKMKSPVIIFSNEGKIKFANKAASDLWKYDHDSLLKLTLDDLFEKTINFEGKPAHQFFIDNSKELINKPIQLFIKTRDNSIHKVNIDLIELKLDSDSYEFTLIVTKISSRNKDEKSKELLEKCYAKELEYILKIEMLEDYIKQNNIQVPQIEISKNLINWSDKFKLGIEVIDNQHKKWIEFINQLYRALKNAEAENILNEIFTQLIEYTKYHFSFEEKYMKEFNFEDIVNHKKEHENFVNELFSMFNDYLNENADIPFNLIIYLKKWVEHHVLVTDRKYSDLFKRKGL